MLKKKIFLNKILNIVIANTLTSIFLIVIIEIILGNWITFLKKGDYKIIPGLIKNRELIFDSSNLYDDKSTKIIYSRDKLGYRSRSKNSNRAIVLTIGGSTTDQRHVSEGETWQDVLDNMNPKYDFVNGGISGHSTYGHLVAIKNWHSKIFDKNDIHSIIYYVGINESLNPKKYQRNWRREIDWNLRLINQFLKSNSFIIQRSIIARNRINFFLNKKVPKHNSYFKRDIDFLDKGITYPIDNYFKLSDYTKYQELITELIKTTKIHFPNSRIVFIQQQIPGCVFINNEYVVDKHPFISKSESFCLTLSKIYKLQESVIKSISDIYPVQLEPMYLKQIIREKDVFDYTHTNKEGSFRIAKFINSIFR